MGAEDETSSVQYLLTEFRTLAQGLEQLGELLASRVNIYLTLVTAVLGAGFVLYRQSGFDDQLLNYSLVAALFIVLAVGLLVYAEMVDFVVRMMFSHRLQSAIREYFLIRDRAGLQTFADLANVQLRIYAPCRTARDFLAVQLGAKQIVTVLNNSVSATLGLMGTLIFVKCTDPRILGIIGGLCFLGIWFVQYVYSRIRYRIAETDLEQRARGAFIRLEGEEADENQKNA